MATPERPLDAARFEIRGGVICLKGKPGGPAPPPSPSTTPSLPAPSSTTPLPAPPAARAYKVSTLDNAAREAVILSVGEECIQVEELRALLAARPHPRCYDGFEPSGRMHIAQGILKATNVNKLTSAGCVFTFWVADWFALLNNKLGGDLKKIRTVGLYMIEVWRAAGMDMQNVEFVWASDEINANANAYWLRVMDIARRFNLPRLQRCCGIMGRKETEELPAASILYPAMQCADIFHLKADICQLGMDQRKVNMLAREYCDVAEPKIRFKPIILSHHMLAGLKEGQEKMSKSDPDSAIFMEDTEPEVRRKVKAAFCPPGVVAGNPCLDWMKHIVFGRYPSVSVSRTPENGGDVEYTSYAALEADFAGGGLHPSDLKAVLIAKLNECVVGRRWGDSAAGLMGGPALTPPPPPRRLLEPVRKHFASGEPAKLLEQVKKFRITR